MINKIHKRSIKVASTLIRFHEAPFSKAPVSIVLVWMDGKKESKCMRVYMQIARRSEIPKIPTLDRFKKQLKRVLPI